MIELKVGVDSELKLGWGRCGLMTGFECVYVRSFPDYPVDSSQSGE
jgi:hypothetical protein